MSADHHITAREFGSKVDIRTGDRASLIKARDLALNAVATTPHSWTRDIFVLMADIANHVAFADVEAEVVADALALCRQLMRDQCISGKIEGIYPS